MNQFDTALKLKESGNFTEAEKIFRSILKNDAHNLDVRLHLGNTLVLMERLEEGISELRKNLAYAPHHILSAYNLGYALFLAQKFNEALMSFSRALELKPDMVAARINRGSTFHALGLLDSALEDFDKTLLQEPGAPEAHWNRALTLLTMSKYSEGWLEYEWRWLRENQKRTYPYNYTQPRWDGSPFPDQRLLVYSEQGFGDTIQFSRFLPQVKVLGGKVIFEVRKELAPIFAEFNGIDELVIFSHQKPQTINFDLCIPLLSLPLCLNCTFDNIPAPATLNIPADKQQFWHRRTDKNKLNIGLAWAGQSTHTNDRHRSFSLETMNPLAELDNIQLYSLQTGAAAQQVKNFPDKKIVEDCAPFLQDFGDTASLISELDLIICVDTAIGHLAASLGKPTFILLSYVPDWRWLRGSHNSRWYPSVTLLRQTSPGNWSELFTRLLKKLQKFNKTPNQSQSNEINHPTPQTVSFEKGKVLQKAVTLHQSGELEKAALLYQEILYLYPETPDALHLLGVIAHQQNKHQKSLTLIKQALHLNPDAAAYYFNAGEAFQALQEYTKACESYGKAIDLQQEYPEAWNRLALAYHKQGDFSSAYDAYKRAISLRQDFPQALNNFGLLQFQKEDFAEAVQLFRKALDFQPNYPEACHNLAITLQQTGMVDEALFLYERTLELAPNHPGVQRQFTRLLQKTCEWERLRLALQQLKSNTAEALFRHQRPEESPFLHLSHSFNQQENLLIARSWTQATNRLPNNATLN